MALLLQFGNQQRQRLPGISDDWNRRRDVLADLSRVDVGVDNGRSRSEGVQAAGDAVVERARRREHEDALAPSAQIALFNAFNRARASGQTLLLAGSQPPLGLALREDLRTRIGQCLIYEVRPLDDAARAAILSALAERRGLRVIIAGAGGAAHLPGMVASHTVLPVIGVPVMAKSLDGLDSLLSIVQMPPGVPVATVGIGAARNAGILAVQILATGDPALRNALFRFKARLVKESRAKNKTLAAA